MTIKEEAYRFLDGFGCAEMMRAREVTYTQVVDCLMDEKEWNFGRCRNLVYEYRKDNWLIGKPSETCRESV